MQPGLSTRSESVVQRYNEHLAVAGVAIARSEDDEVVARVICRLADQITELVQTPGLADQYEAIVLGLNFASPGAFDQFFQKPSHRERKTPLTVTVKRSRSFRDEALSMCRLQCLPNAQTPRALRSEDRGRPVSRDDGRCGVQ